VERGSQAVATGLAAAAAGSGRATTALGRLASGAHEIRTGQHRAALGALALKFDIRDLIPRLRHSTLLPSHKLQQELTGMQNTLPQLESHAEEADRQLGAALLEFQKMSEVPDDPHYSSALSAVQAAQNAIAGETASSSGETESRNSGLSAELQDLGANVLHATERAGKVASGLIGRLGELEEAGSLSARLVGGLNQLEHGGQSLDSGTRRLARSTSALADGLPRLSRGATALSGGTEKLALGTSSLASNLGHAYTLSHPLGPGLHKAARQSTSGGASLQRQSRRLRQLSPGIFNSGYFNLSALDGTPVSVRSKVERVVNLNSGGQAARILVIPKYRSHTAGSVALDNRLRASTPQLGKRIDGTAGVAGGPAEFNDYARTSKSSLPVVIAVVSLVTFLSLVIILRALLVPALTVLLNLLSVAAAFGVLALLSELPSGAPLGNWEYIDTIGAIAIFAIAFGLSIDYSVFILVRIREDFDRHGDNAAAVRFGVQRTGRVITGAAIIMVAVFATFATSSLTIVSQLGIGLTVAILVDATIIRLVLLPALLLLIGERCWWLPAPLGRLIADLRLA
jgi:RND superfamily putative drug exporter